MYRRPVFKCADGSSANVRCLVRRTSMSSNRGLTVPVFDDGRIPRMWTSAEGAVGPWRSANPHWPPATLVVMNTYRITPYFAAITGALRAGHRTTSPGGRALSVLVTRSGLHATICGRLHGLLHAADPVQATQQSLQPVQLVLDNRYTNINCSKACIIHRGRSNVAANRTTRGLQGRQPWRSHGAAHPLRLQALLAANINAIRRRVRTHIVVVAPPARGLD
mmetsp:Transcript_84086/g.224775  ORF Transcript_84086/g.224775 Transcript_84086/m.224775 type:complete len:221 (+) Transcript_84086:1098-1760(+)